VGGRACHDSAQILTFWYLKRKVAKDSVLVPISGNANTHCLAFAGVWAWSFQRLPTSCASAATSDSPHKDQCTSVHAKVERKWLSKNLLPRLRCPVFGVGAGQKNCGAPAPLLSRVVVAEDWGVRRGAPGRVGHHVRSDGVPFITVTNRVTPCK